MTLGRVLVAMAVLAAGLLVLVNLPVGLVAISALLAGAFLTITAQHRNREQMRRRPDDLRRAGDDEYDSTDPYKRASGLNAWMRGGRS